MSHTAEQTESIRDYAQMLGAPDPTITARMRAKLDGYIERRRRVRRRIAIACAVALAGAAIAFAVTKWSDADAPRAVLVEAAGQTLELGGARIELGAGAKVVPNPRDVRSIELDGGEVTLEIPPGAAFVVRTAGFEVHAADASLQVRHTAGVPVVTVQRGEARMVGPGLPAAGVVVLPRGR